MSAKHGREDALDALNGELVGDADGVLTARAARGSAGAPRNLLGKQSLLSLCAMVSARGMLAGLCVVLAGIERVLVL